MAGFGYDAVEDDIDREFARLDANNDGYVDFLEFGEGGDFGMSSFQEADTNRDGRLSKAEYALWYHKYLDFSHKPSTKPGADPNGWLDSSPLWVRLTLSGALAGTVTKTSTAPLDRVKVLLQVQSISPGTKDKYNGLIGSTRTLVAEEGFSSLWKGNGANCARVVPVYACRFAFNDLIKEAVREPDQRMRDLRVSQLALSGTGAGLAQQLICYPFETVRTRLSLGKAFGTQYKGITDCFLVMIRTEGPRSLYMGLTASCLYGAPYVGLNMTLNTQAKYYMVDDPDQLTLVHKLAAGSFAATTAQCVVFPFDTLRRRMQADGQGNKERVFKGLTDCTRQLVRQSGLRGFYFGIGANCARMIPTGAIQHVSYGFFKTLLNCD